MVLYRSEVGVEGGAAPKYPLPGMNFSITFQGLTVHSRNKIDVNMRDSEVTSPGGDVFIPTPP